MKRLLILAALFSLAATQSMAAVGETRVGLQGGVNLGTAMASARTAVGATSVDIPTNARTALAVGLYGEYLFHDFLGVRPELMFVSKGAKTGTAATEVSSSFNYFEIPVLLEARFDQAEFHPFLFAGPNVGFKTSATASNTTSGASTDIANVRSLDFALDMGGGLEYAVTKQIGVQFNVRYSLSLTDAIDATPDLIDWKHRGVQFMAGVSYGL